MNTKVDGFMLNHFNENVTYDVSQFLAKNMEDFHRDTIIMFDKSNLELAKQIGGGRKKKKKRTTTGTFVLQIGKLMKNLESSDPFFIYCIRPNLVKSKTIWTQSVVQHQLTNAHIVQVLNGTKRKKLIVDTEEKKNDNVHADQQQQEKKAENKDTGETEQ